MTYSSSWQILEEYDDGSLTNRYVYSPIYVDALLFRDRDVDSNGSLEERIFALQDANYNIIALTDSTGTVIDRMEYKPFGEVSILNDNVDWKHYYQGGRADETTGLISFRYRWYSPELGRWTQQDPIHFAAGDINIYRAISNDPLNGLDPSGLLPIVVPGIIAIFFILENPSNAPFHPVSAAVGIAAGGIAGRIGGKMIPSIGSVDGMMIGMASGGIVGGTYDSPTEAIVGGAAAGITGVAIGGAINRVLKPRNTLPPVKLELLPIEIPVVRLFHKGELGPCLSKLREFSTGLDKTKVESLIRPGSIHEFAVPKDVLDRWMMQGKVRTIKDLDQATGIINEEIRFSPTLAEELIKYRVQP